VRQIADYIQTQSQLNGSLTLTGASYRGISVNDCIYHAKLDTQPLTASLGVD